MSWIEMFRWQISRTVSIKGRNTFTSMSFATYPVSNRKMYLVTTVEKQFLLLDTKCVAKCIEIKVSQQPFIHWLVRSNGIDYFRRNALVHDTFFFSFPGNAKQRDLRLYLEQFANIRTRSLTLREIAIVTVRGVITRDAIGMPSRRSKPRIHKRSIAFRNKLRMRV